MGRMGDTLLKLVTDYPLISIALLCFAAALILGIARVDLVAISFIAAGLALTIIGIAHKGNTK